MLLKLHSIDHGHVIVYLKNMHSQHAVVIIFTFYLKKKSLFSLMRKECREYIKA